jgi:hypothetical protein
MPDGVLAPLRCEFSYVSNQSQLPEAFHRDALRRMAKDDRARTLLEHLFEKIACELEEDPRHAVGRPAMIVLAQAMEATGIQPDSAQADDTIARFYIHPLTELIFRQQALGWAADYCEARGLRLSLYGRGWERHPRFAKYARGIAENGEQLRAIYQASAVNLQVIGSGAIHTRLLDGLAAGGFFMIRFVPIDAMKEPIGRLLEEVDRLGIQSDCTYREDGHAEFASALRDLYRFETGWAGPPTRLTQANLARYRGMAEDRFRRNAGAVFADYPQVVFDSEDAFSRVADACLANPERRRDLAAAMREDVLRQFTYGAFVDQLLEFIEQRLRAPVMANT